MPKEITLAEALKLVAFDKSTSGEWQIKHILGDVYGEVCSRVYGNVWGDVHGDLWGDVYGDVWGDVQGDVYGEGFIEPQGNETSMQKLERLIKETGHTELLEAFNQLEGNQ
jgi:hypothetical protein